MNYTQRLKEEIKEYCRMNGLKQKYIAEKCGFTPTQFSLLLNGGRTLTADDIGKICQTLDIRPEKIFTLPVHSSA